MQVRQGMDRVFIIIGTLLFLGFVTYIDVVAGATPDITILYLLPVIAGLVYIGIRYAVFLAVLGSGLAVIDDILLHIGHFNIFLTSIIVIGLHASVALLVVYLADKLIMQLQRVNKLEDDHERDLKIAQEVHQSVFEPAPKWYDNVSIGHRKIFAKEIGGDYYYFADFHGKLFVTIADISGKSVAAAIFTPLLAHCITQALQKEQTLDGIITYINNSLYSVMPSNMFVTLFGAFIDETSIEYINAGHEPPVFVTEKICILLESYLTLPLGIVSTLEVKPKQLSYEVGDILVLYTDGVTDSKFFRGEDSYTKLQRIVEEKKNKSPQELANHIFDLVVSFSERPADDVTIISLKKRG